MNMMDLIIVKLFTRFIYRNDRIFHRQWINYRPRQRLHFLVASFIMSMENG